MSAEDPQFALSFSNRFDIKVLFIHFLHSCNFSAIEILAV